MRVTIALVVPSFPIRPMVLKEISARLEITARAAPQTRYPALRVLTKLAQGHPSVKTVPKASTASLARLIRSSASTDSAPRNHRRQVCVWMEPTDLQIFYVFPLKKIVHSAQKANTATMGLSRATVRRAISATLVPHLPETRPRFAPQVTIAFWAQ